MAAHMKYSSQVATAMTGTLLFALVGSVQGVLLDTPTWQEFFGGLMIGGTVGILVMAVEILVFPSPALRKLRSLPLGAYFLIRLCTWCVIIFTVLTAIGPPPSDPEWLAMIVVSLILSTLVLSIFMIQRIIGHRTLVNLMTGRYYRPRLGNYAFLLIDLKGSTSAAEKIGHQSFFMLLNQFVTDVSERVRVHGGDIYKYVGDEIIAVWEMSDEKSLSRALRCWCDISADMDDKRTFYENTFGVAPNFHAALHCGEVTVGQIGSYRQEIAMLGDPLNVVSRILEYSSQNGLDFVISAPALDGIADKNGVQIKPLGAVTLRGSEQPIKLNAVEKPKSDLAA